MRKAPTSQSSLCCASTQAGGYVYGAVTQRIASSLTDSIEQILLKISGSAPDRQKWRGHQKKGWNTARGLEEKQRLVGYLLPGLSPGRERAGSPQADPPALESTWLTENRGGTAATCPAALVSAAQS